MVGLRRGLTAAGLLAALAAGVPTPAAAHDATSVVHATVTDSRLGSGPGSESGSWPDVQAVLELEYDLLMKSAWLYAEAYEATERAEQLRQLERNSEAVRAYVAGRFAVSYADEPCTPAPAGPADLRERDDRAFAVVTLRYDCPGERDGSHAVRSALFPDAEGFVHSTRTIVVYDVGGLSGTAVLDASEPIAGVDPASDPAPSDVATARPATDNEGVAVGRGRLRELGDFFVLGAEHLLLGPDHLLFLVALVLASRRLGDVALAATTFTVAHSVTFLLASLGVVGLPSGLVEPVIALSIVAVAGVQLLGVRRAHAEGPLARRLRLPVVFGFGLLHGLGFAGALGIEERWSWDLLWSLLSFNIGIELAQLAVVALLFPLLVLLRRTRAAAWVVPTVAAGTTAVGLYWFTDRLPGGLPFLQA